MTSSSACRISSISPAAESLSDGGEETPGPDSLAEKNGKSSYL
jgi:hypothetical protein